MTFSLPYGIKPSFVPGRAVTGGFSIFDDFLAAGTVSTTANAALWLFSDTGAGSAPVAGVIQDDADGGAIQIGTNATSAADNDSAIIQANGESFRMTQNRGLYFETRLQLSTVSSDLLCGVSINTTDPIGTEPTHYVAFRTNGDGSLLTEARNNDTTTAVDTGVDLVAATNTILAFEYKRDGKIHFYVDGVRVQSKATWSTNASSLPLTQYMSPFVCIQTTSAAAITADIDYVFCGTDERD